MYVYVYVYIYICIFYIYISICISKCISILFIYTIKLVLKRLYLGFMVDISGEISPLRTPQHSPRSNCSCDPRGDGFREAAKTVLYEQRMPLTAARTSLQDAIDRDLAISPKTICAVYGWFVS